MLGKKSVGSLLSIPTGPIQLQSVLLFCLFFLFFSLLGTPPALVSGGVEVGSELSHFNTGARLRYAREESARTRTASVHARSTAELKTST